MSTWSRPIRASDWSRLAEQVLARAPVAVRSGPHVVAGLGRDDELVAVRREVLAEDPAEVGLGRAVGRAVVVRQVEVGHAAVEGPAEDGALGLERLVVPEVVPEPERDRRAAPARCGRSGGRAAPRSGRRRAGRRARSSSPESSGRRSSVRGVLAAGGEPPSWGPGHDGRPRREAGPATSESGRGRPRAELRRPAVRAPGRPAGPHRRRAGQRPAQRARSAPTRTAPSATPSPACTSSGWPSWRRSRTGWPSAGSTCATAPAATSAASGSPTTSRPSCSSTGGRRPPATFYQATAASPGDVVRRRHLATRGRSGHRRRGRGARPGRDGRSRSAAR